MKRFCQTGRRATGEQIMTYLRNAEVGEEDAAEASRSPDEEHLDTEVCVACTRVDEVRR